MKYLTFSILLIFLCIGCESNNINDPSSEQGTSFAKKSRTYFELDTDDYTAEIIFTGLTAPEGITTVGNGRILTTNAYEDGIVRVINPAGKISEFAEVEFIFGNEALVDITACFTKGGYFATLIRAGKVVKIKQNGTVSDYCDGFLRPLIITKNSQNELFVSEFGASFPNNGYISKISDLQRQVIIDLPNRAKAFTFDDDDILYVSTFSPGGTIRKFILPDEITAPIDFDDGELYADLSAYPDPNIQDMVFDDEGNMFASAESTLYKIKTNGDVEIITDDLAGPFNHLTKAPNGSIYLTHYGAGQILKITKNK